MNLKTFYQRFENTPKEKRFQLIDIPSEPTSLFVIFQQLSQVRAQIRYFQEREAHLLKLAEEGFKNNNGESL
jgi:hypothetical protein